MKNNLCNNADYRQGSLARKGLEKYETRFAHRFCCDSKLRITVMKERFAVPPAVYVVLFRHQVMDSQYEILLMRRANTGYMDGRWGLPAGHLDPNESLIGGAARELKEEAGVSLTENDLELVHVAHTAPEKPNDHKDQRIDFYFKAILPEGAVPSIKEPHKCDGMAWYSLNSLPDNVVPRVLSALEDISSKKMFSEHGWDLA